jgi:hypothetical protein
MSTNEKPLFLDEYGFLPLKLLPLKKKENRWIISSESLFHQTSWEEKHASGV